jgi:DNA-directed RNA polymerase specialized sigma24 family protein
MGFRYPDRTDYHSVSVGCYMSMSQTLAPHLPHLRRYARVLTGSQNSGDAHVRAALMALLEGRQALIEGVPRVGLYRLFHAIWQTGAEHFDEASATPSGKSTEGCLRFLSATKRAALLLTTVEAFSLEEVAFILDENPEEMKRIVLEARKTIGSYLAGRVLIIKDEPIIVHTARDKLRPAAATLLTAQPSSKISVDPRRTSAAAHESSTRRCRVENKRQSAR